ncbi:response regulator transcription factor [Actinoallomurus acanthiterrae]
MIQILLAEYVTMLRHALVTLLELEDGMTVVAELARGDDVVPAALKYEPDIAVIDIDLPGIDGLTAAAALRRRLPECRTVILVGVEKPAILRQAFDVQAEGLILKDASPAELADAIRQVARGEQVISPQLTGTMLRYSASPLTPRETEVLRLTAAGAGASEIASTLLLSAGTVRNHLTSALTKLRARNRVDAVRIATQFDWI